MVVRMRHTRSHTRNRRSHHGVGLPRLSRDEATGSWHLRHRVDLKTGQYRGRQVLAASEEASTTKKTEEKVSKRKTEQPKATTTPPPTEIKAKTSPEAPKHSAKGDMHRPTV